MLTTATAIAVPAAVAAHPYAAGGGPGWWIVFPILWFLLFATVVVLVEVAGGLSNDEIASALYLSESTVKTHVSRVMTKLRARDRAQLVVTAYEAGIVRPGWGRGH